MRIRLLQGVVLTVALFAGVVTTRADQREVEALREKAAALVREALELSKAGRHEQAREALQHAHAMHAEAHQIARLARPPQPPPDEVAKLDAHLAELQKSIEHLHQRGEADAAQRLQKQVHEAAELLRSHRVPEAAKLLEHLSRTVQDKAAPGEKLPPRKKPLPPRNPERVQHLLEAAEHLRAAGMPEEAEELLQHVKELHKEPAPPKGPPALDHRIDELAHVVQRLSERVEKLERALKRQADKEDDDDEDDDDDD